MDGSSRGTWYTRTNVMFGIIIGFLAITTIFTGYTAFRSRDVDVNYSPGSAPTKKTKIEGRLNVKLVKENDDSKGFQAKCGVTTNNGKFECHPEPGATEARCLVRGCCWSSAPPAKIVGLPSCYYPPNYSGYKVVSIGDTPWGLQARLKRDLPSSFPMDIKEVDVKVSFMDKDRVNIKISDPNAVRYEVPFPTLNKVIKGRGLFEYKYDVAIDVEGRLTVNRKSDGVTIFDANLSTMIFADQLLQINIKTPNEGYYGIGESKDVLLRGVGWRRYFLFNRDNYPTEELNMYGTHPFYLQMEKDSGNAHGVFLFNSNAMEVVTQPTPGITFRTIGGVFDFYVFMGPTPGSVIQQYTDLIGHTFLPPYWSLGFHLCRYGYGSLNATKAAWKRTRDANIPFDVQWNDIDYMDHYDDFIVDKKTYGNLGAFVKEIHKENMHYVMITDVGIGGPDLAGQYQPYDDGVKMDCLVKNSSGDLLIGKVWNEGATCFPDFTHPRAAEYLTRQYKLLYDQVEYDGSWIDMNEPANFVNGSVEGCPTDNTLDYPPYTPGHLEPIYTRTLCMSAQHHASTHYNVHSIHSLSQAIATNRALRNIRNRRPFIISRSSYAGLGRYAGHWNGDISSNWDNYRWSIPSILTFGMFGVSMMGADICGFKWNTTEELCARWQTLGAFYPFSRNHNDFDTIEQDPVKMGPRVTKATRESLLIRYKLLPFLYTLFYKSHVNGETVARPLFFEFPQDNKTYAIDSTFLWGPSLMIIPVLEAGKDKVSAYIPNDVWYDYHTNMAQQGGKVLDLDAPLEKINLLVRGGYIIPTQEPGMTTYKSRMNKFGLLVALKDGIAMGELYWDDGDSLETYEKKQYTLVEFAVANKKLESAVVQAQYKSAIILGEIKFLGSEKMNNVKVNGMPASSEYSELTKASIIKDLAVSLLEPLTVDWT